MPGITYSNVIPMLAGGTITADHVVKLSADNTVVECTADTDVSIGIARDSGVSGDTIGVAVWAVPNLYLCSEAITFNNYITPHTDATVKTWAAGDTKIALAITTTATAGEYVKAIPMKPEAASESATFVNLVATGNTTLGDAGTDTVTITGDLGLTGDSVLTGDLNVTGAVTLDGDVTLGDADTDTITVTGTATIAEDLTCSKDVSVGVDLAVTGDTTLNGDVTLGNADTDTITVTGTATIAEDLTCSKDVSVGVDFDVTGATTLNGDVTLGDADTDTVTVTGTATVAEDLTCSKDVSVGVDLDVTGATTLNGDVTLGDADTDTVTVTGTATVAEDLTCSKDVSVGVDLAVTGATTLNGDVTLGDAIADTVTLSGTPDINQSSPSLHHATDAIHIDGKATTTLWTADQHPPAQILQAWVELIEVADGGATTYTIKLTDGSNDVTDTVTFTQGTEAAFAKKVFTVNGTYDNLAADGTLNVVTAGTTTTAGECIVTIAYVGEAA